MNSELQKEVFKKVDFILKSFNSLLSVNVSTQRLHRKEQKEPDFNVSVIQAQRLVKLNHNGKALYQKYLSEVGALYREYHHLEIWPRLVSRFNEALIETNKSLGECGYIKQEFFEADNQLKKIFVQLERQNMQGLKKLHKTIYLLEMENEKENVFAKGTQLRPSMLFNKKQQDQTLVSAKEARQNLYFLEAIRQLEKHASIINDHSNADMIEIFGFDLEKKLYFNVENLMENMLKRNDMIAETINKYAKGYQLFKQKSKTNRNSKIFMESIRNIKNNTKPRPSNRISALGRISNKTSLFMNSVNIEMLLEQRSSGRCNKPSKFLNSCFESVPLELPSQIFTQSSQSINDTMQQRYKTPYGYSRNTTQKRPCDHENSVGLVKIQEIEESNLMKSNIDQSKTNQNNLNQKFIKASKYTFITEGKENVQTNISRKGNLLKGCKSSNSTINNKLDHRLLSDVQARKEIPLFLAIKDGKNLHNWTCQEYELHGPYVNELKYNSRFVR